MGKRLEFFYDYVSSYSYLADSQLHTLGAGGIAYRPMFLGAVMQATENRPPASLPARGAWLRRDLERWAARYGIGFRMNPRFPQNTLGALRLAIVAQHDGGFAGLHRRLFDAMWIEGRDLSDADVLRELAAAAGMDADRALARSSDQAIKDELKANTDEAVRRGAFGAPTFFVDGELYFGNDRLDFVREALQAVT